MVAYTDYPFIRLGDEPGFDAPIRQVEVIGTIGDKYCQVQVGGIVEEIKRGYVYSQPGRLGEVPQYFQIKDGRYV